MKKSILIFCSIITITAFYQGCSVSPAAEGNSSGAASSAVSAASSTGSSGSSSSLTSLYSEGPVYVSPSGLDTADGTLAAPVLTIQRALEIAKASHYTNVFVQAGTYTVNSGLTNINGSGLLIDKSPALYLCGGWNTDYSSRGSASVLDGMQVLSNIVCIRDSKNIAIEGFVIKGGTNGVYTGFGTGYGGGLYVNNVINLSLSNIAVMSNYSLAYGGGIFIMDCYNLIFDGTVRDNCSTGCGGGLFLAEVSNAVISGSISGNSITGSWNEGVGAEVFNGYNISLKADIYDNFSAASGYTLHLQYCKNVAVTGSIFSNTVKYISGISDWYGDGNVITALIFDNTASELNGEGVIDLFQTKSILITGTTIINNHETNAIYMEEANNVQIVSNYIGGDGSGCAIYEYYLFDITGQTIKDNVFFTNKLAYLYYDSKKGSTVSIAAVNDSSYSGSAFAGGNIVSNY